MSTMLRGAVVSAGALLLASGCVTAEQIEKMSVLPACDGYGNMEQGADGITQLGSGFWEAPGSRIRSTPRLGQAGINSCSRALAILDEQYPENWMRKVSLLQARAMHYLSDKKVELALADLDAAEAAVRAPSDVFYRRALGLNTQLIRAFALAQADRRQDAEALALKAFSERPYVRGAGLAALTAVGPGGSPEAISQLLSAAGRIHPNLSELQFKQMFETGRYEEAIAIAETLKAPVPVRDQTYDQRANMLAAESKRAEEANFWVDIMGRKAFAYAALGREAEAQAALADAARRIDAAKVTPTTLPAKPSTDDRMRQAVQVQVNREIETKAPPVQKFWTSLVKAQLAKNAGDTAGVAAAMEGVELESATSVFFALGAKDKSGEELAQHEVVKAIAVGLPPPTAAMLFEFLLDAETPTRAQQTLLGLDGLFASAEQKERGDCSEGRTDDGLESLCFKGVEATNAITEERVLLRAAEKTLAQGATHFIIERRRDIQHSTVMTNYSVVVAQHEMGFESRIDIRMLKADEVGPTCWRCISASEVQALLAPVYRIKQAKAGGAS